MQPPANFGFIVIFRKQLPISKWCKYKFVAFVHDDDSVFKAEKNLFVMQNLGNLWANVGMG